MRHVNYTSGVRSFSRDADGFPVLDYDLERAVKAVDSFNRLFWNTKGGLYTGGTSYDAAKSAASKNVFKSGSVLFFCGRLSSYTSFRSMEDDYGVIPYPTLDEEQGEYTNAFSNSDTFVAVPATCPNPVEVGAVIELLAAEGCRQILEPFYETALKLKYARDSYTGECLDIIRNVTVKELFYDYGDTLGSPFSIYSNAAKNTNTHASDFASKKESIETKLKALKEEYKKIA